MPSLRSRYTSRLAASRLIAERSRASSSTAVRTASAGIAALSFAIAGAKAPDQHYLALRFATERAGHTVDLFHRRHRLPTEHCKQPDRRLLNELVFGVSVEAHGSGGLARRDLTGHQAWQEQVASPAQVPDLSAQSFDRRFRRGREFAESSLEFVRWHQDMELA